AGSTGGGIKCVRLLLLLKCAYKEIFKLIHPHAVTQIKLGKKAIPSDVISGVIGLFVLYISLFIVFSMSLAAMGMDFISSIAAVAATMGNIGPGLAMVGPVKNYDLVPYFGKWVLILCMLLGRLEIYTIIVLFTPEFWRK
ncbi:MAG: TrkH family potassium uptake protein, partial [Thermodesulfobacteriota bacterium]